MTMTQKAMEVKDWFAAKNDLGNGQIVAIIKESEKAVYALVWTSFNNRKTTWIPKSCIDTREEQDIMKQTVIAEYEEAVERLADLRRYWN